MSMSKTLSPEDESHLKDLFTYHGPGREDNNRFELIRETALELARVIYLNCPGSPDRSVALRQLRQAVYSANASIALKGRG